MLEVPLLWPPSLIVLVAAYGHCVKSILIYTPMFFFCIIEQYIQIIYRKSIQILIENTQKEIKVPDMILKMGNDDEFTDGEYSFDDLSEGFINFQSILIRIYIEFKNNFRFPILCGHGEQSGFHPNNSWISWSFLWYICRLMGLLLYSPSVTIKYIVSTKNPLL